MSQQYALGVLGALRTSSLTSIICRLRKPDKFRRKSGRKREPSAKSPCFIYRRVKRILWYVITTLHYVVSYYPQNQRLRLYCHPLLSLHEASMVHFSVVILSYCHMDFLSPIFRHHTDHWWCFDCSRRIDERFDFKIETNFGHQCWTRQQGSDWTGEHPRGWWFLNYLLLCDWYKPILDSTRFWPISAPYSRSEPETRTSCTIFRFYFAHRPIVDKSRAWHDRDAASNYLASSGLLLWQKPYEHTTYEGYSRQRHAVACYDRTRGVQKGSGE